MSESVTTVTDDEDWCIEASDEENQDDEPDIKDIIELYNKMSKDGILEFEWKNPGRRLPEEEKVVMETTQVKKEEESEKKDEEAPTEFDFDSFSSEPSEITPRRTPASTKTPRTQQKRVATMDKILGDIYRKKKEEKPKSKGILFGESTPPPPTKPVPPMPNIFQSPIVPYAASPGSENPASSSSDTTIT